MMITRVYLQLCIVLILSVNAALSGTPVEYLPGYSGKLPFKLQTGYISVDESELFYYFTESQNSPQSDPLFLWLAGGPGCSSISGFLYANGPLRFDDKYYGGLPTLEDYPYSWTQNASFIYVDAPIGTGFSYSTTQQGWSTSDSKSAEQSFHFIIKWLEEHPQYLRNSLFIGGDSYSGITIPHIVKKIVDGNEAGQKPRLNIKGYLVGSPRTDSTMEANSKFVFAHRMYLLSDELYESAKTSCEMDFINVDPSNTQCLRDVQAMKECLRDVNGYSILEPNCDWTFLNLNSAYLRKRSLQEDHQLLQKSYTCKVPFVMNTLSYIWANDERVQDALHIRKGHIRKWKRCNGSLSDSYDKDVSSVVDVHRYLSTKDDLQVLVQCGDHDMAVPIEETMKWLKSLNLRTEEEWRPWLLQDQVLGFTRLYSSDSGGYRLTFATVKGAGHTAPEYKREECYYMFQRWIQSYPL